MARCGVSGLAATAIDVLSLIGFVELVGLPVGIAAFLSASLGAIVNFTVSKLYAFRDPRPTRVGQLATFALVALTTAVFVATSVHLLAVDVGLPYLVAKALASGGVFLVWSYPAQSRIVFRGAPAAAARAVRRGDPGFTGAPAGAIELR
jgi:putative flippase GtrA